MPIHTIGGPAQPMVLYDSTGNALGTSSNPLAIGGNSDGIALASAARTSAPTIPPLTNPIYRGVIVILNVTVASGTGGLTVRIRGIDPVSGTQYALNASPTAVTAVGTYAYELYPGASAAAVGGSPGNMQRTAAALPRQWAIAVGHGDTSSYTYSVGYSLMN